MSPDTIFEKFTSKGDIAAACVGFSIGFICDVFLFPQGIASSTTAGVFAVGSVGLKNSIDAALETVKEARRRRKDKRELETRARLLLEALEQEENEASEGLRRSLALWEMGILTEKHVEGEFAEGLRCLRLNRDVDLRSSVSTARFRQI